MMRSLLAWTGFLGLTLLLGLVGLSLVFSDLGPNESVLRRSMLVVAYFAVTGLLLGYLSPGHWSWAGLVAWGPILLGVGSFLGNLSKGWQPALMSLVLCMPLLLALAGAYLTHILRKRRHR